MVIYDEVSNNASLDDGTSGDTSLFFVIVAIVSIILLTLDLIFQL
jgi:hypothetical protein